MIGTLIVIAKNPVPGRVKTRLVPPYTHDQAAELAAASLTDTLDAASRIPARRRLLAFEGDSHDWVGHGWDVVPQVDGDLDVRLAAAFAHSPDGPAVLVGMDTPQLRPDHLRSIGEDGVEGWFGPAVDGGFWLIGFADPAHAATVLPGVPMSRSDTGAQQLQRMRDAGLTVRLMDTLVDVDDAGSAHVVAGQAPLTGFARTLRRIDAQVEEAVG